MENLTKHQLVLVALLISFVTSIATGIVTVSLMDQAPKGVTQTINRVVEKTVERVVTEPKKGGEIVKETIVVKEEDKIIEAIEKNAKSMVRIYKTEPAVGAEVPLKSFAGLGIIISKDGDIATDASIISPSGSYSAVLNDGKEYPVKSGSVAAQEKKIIEILKIIPKEKEIISLTPAVLADSDNLKLGQTVISLGGKLRNSVSIGVITSFVESGGVFENFSSAKTTALPIQNASSSVSSSAGNLIAVAGESLKENTSQSKGLKDIAVSLSGSFAFVETNIVLSDNTTGNPFINLSSEVIGIRVKEPSVGQTASFVPINVVKKSLSAVSGTAGSSANSSKSN